ncbi:hypothetical protein [Streptomyces sp. NPDC047009]|uniref:hypothetical protein n=1 Tax=Streptomyces sp. NPDC047009 TaxID=3154496 RepID=UPI003404BDE7
MSLPLRAPQAKKLIAVARPALFGQGEETLSDTSVRDIWQIAPDQITLAGPALPGAVRVGEVDLEPGVDAELGVLGQFRATVPGQ